MNIVDVEKRKESFSSLADRRAKPGDAFAHRRACDYRDRGNSIDLAEDRKRFATLLRELEHPATRKRMAAPVTRREGCRGDGYPVLVRPS